MYFAVFNLLFIITLSHALPESSVLVFRHCLRSTPTSAYGAPGFNEFNNYSSPQHQFPTWPVPVYQCLPRGLVLNQAAGKQILSSLPTPIVFKVDTSAKRDNDTANALLQGMGSTTPYESAPELFNPVGTGNCPKLNKEIAINALKARFQQSMPPINHIQRLTQLQTILGKGVAPSIPSIADTVKDNGYFTGGSSIASEFNEAFLMQWGGQLPTAWNEIKDVSEIYDLLETHVYYRGVNDKVFPVVSRSHSMMSNVIVNHLKSGTGTLILVGHDGDLDALGEMFGLEWETSPFPKNASTPGSALRFDASASSSIAASVHYQNFNGSMHVDTVSAEFQWTEDDMPSLKSIENWLKPRLDPLCE